MEVEFENFDNHVTQEGLRIRDIKRVLGKLTSFQIRICFEESILVKGISIYLIAIYPTQPNYRLRLNKLSVKNKFNIINLPTYL